jgi:hypothetical protein
LLRTGSRPTDGAVVNAFTDLRRRDPSSATDEVSEVVAGQRVELYFYSMSPGEGQTELAGRGF